MKSKRFSKSTCLCITYTIALIVGFIWLFLWSKLYALILNSYFTLKPDNAVYEMWKKNPFPMTIDFYFHNWTNPHDINNASSKPKFEQLGPYRFQETKEKVDITWNDNSTVTFKQLKFWYFDAEHSNGSLDDLVTSIDPVFLSSSYQMRNWNFFIPAMFSMVNNRPIDTTRKVGEVLFTGYQDRLIDLSQSIPFDIVNIPDFDKFGWFYTRNGSTTFEGVFNMATGADNTVGELLRWNYDDRTPFNEGKCGEIRGSAGELFPGNVKRTEIEFFSPDMCRFVKLDYAKDARIHNILGYKFAAGPGLLDNGTLIPENKCFCGGQCVPSGAVNVSACRYGSPAFVSLPHFYGGDSYYVDSVEGIHPDRSKHDFYITLEPTTGIALSVAARLQLNLLLQPIDKISAFIHVPRVFMPVLWFEQKVEMPEELAFKLKLLLNFPIICIGIGCLIVTVALVLLVIQLVYSCMKTDRRGGKGRNYRMNISHSEQVPLNVSKSSSSSDDNKCI